ncbi:hypothetical protein RQP46_004034 [Phenoliferia psychrophenolica]
MRSSVILALSLTAVASASSVSRRAERQPIDLRSAKSFAVLAQSAISNVPASTVGGGDVGVSPAATSTITGLNLIYSTGDPSGTSASVTGGDVYGANMADPTPSKLTQAVGDSNDAATDVWIMQLGGDLNVDNGMKMTLSGGALASNIFWAVPGAAALGTTSTTAGIVSTYKSITLNTGATVNGRLFAQTAVTLQKATVTAPAS